MDPLQGRLRRALAGRYVVDHEIGRGMAVVYLGSDERLGRRVAIKVFERGVSDTGTERFLREIRISAKLQHPNIVPVFEAGEADGLVYYIMPYVAGASLRERLEREGPLPIADTVRIGREVAEGLDHAHRAGIVHRDIKPENIVLADGVAMVADFGIARALADAADKVTETGIAIGTPNYMSPEQGAGSQLIDGRTDIYALGCVLYEMLTGSPPFSGANPRIVLSRHATDPPPPLRTARDVPPALESAVLRAMAKVPADRWSSGREFAEALFLAAPSAMYPIAPKRARFRWLAAAVVLLTVAGSLAWALRVRGVARADTPDGMRSVAVLPFAFSGDSNHRDLADGLTDGIISGLVQIPGIAVPAVNRVAAFRDQNADPREAGRTLKAHYVVWARLHAAGNRLRVTTQLINVADGRVLWHEQFDGDLLVNGQLLDLFAISDSLTLRIVSRLRPRLEASRRSMAARGIRTRNREAYRLYQEAVRIPFFNVHPDSSSRKVALLAEAVRLDSMFADAWAELAAAKQGNAMIRGVPPIDAGPELRRLIAKALAVDSTHAVALMLQARFRWFFDWDWDNALRDARRAAELAPGNVPITSQYFWLLIFTNRFDSALAFVRTRHDTASPNSWLLLAAGYRHAGMPDSALAAAERGRQVDPNAFGPKLTLLREYRMAGRTAEADSIAREFRQLALAGNPNVIGIMARHYGRVGNQAGVQEMLDRLVRLSRAQFVSPTIIAVVRLEAGDREGAIVSLEEAVRLRDNQLPENLPMLYERLKGEPRVEAVRRRVYGNRPIHRVPY